MKPKPVPPKSFLILTRNIRVDQIRVRVRRLHDFFNRDRGQGCHYLSHTHSRTRPDDEIIKILLIIC